MEVGSNSKFKSIHVTQYLPSDSAMAQEMCDAGSDHYCAVSCDRCPDSQHVMMLVGGHQSRPTNQWMMNPTFFALNGSLPACLNSTKNDIVNDGSLNKIKSPGLFTNQSEILSHIIFQQIQI